MSDFLHDSVRAVEWVDGTVRMLDQRVLPHQVERIDFPTSAAVAQAIHDMVVRGAPAIGVAAAYGAVLAGREAFAAHGENWRGDFEERLRVLADARPTAINLRWALDELRAVPVRLDADPEPALLEAARKLHADDIAANRAMAEAGARFLEPGSTVLTHCNTGSLATGGVGTALGVIRAAAGQGKLAKVFACEARPWLQGARLTAWELLEDGIPVTLIADSAAAATIREHGVSWVIVGADRIAANGDTANKIGTFNLALIARALGAKLMVVAPTSTVDLATPDGAAIPVEARSATELTELAGKPVAVPGADAWNPVFDVTPAAYVDVIVTERHVFENPASEPPSSVFGKDP